MVSEGMREIDLRSAFRFRQIEPLGSRLKIKENWFNNTDDTDVIGDDGKRALSAIGVVSSVSEAPKRGSPGVLVSADPGF